MKNLRIDFEACYAGESTYWIDGAKYSARYTANPDFNWNGDYYETGILPAVGAVRHDDSSRWHEFPAPEVVALLPGFVGLRLIFTDNEKSILPFNHPDHGFADLEYQYDRPRPALVAHPLIKTWMTFPHYAETLKREAAENDAMNAAAEAARALGNEAMYSAAVQARDDFRRAHAC